MKYIWIKVIFLALAANSFAELPSENQMPLVSAWNDDWIKKHVDKIIEGANAGNIDAQLTLASIYEMGSFFNSTPGINKIEESETQATHWYQKAANQNSWEALNNLAVMYFHGRGVEENQGKALKLLKQAWDSQEEQIAANLIAANLAFYYMNIRIGGKPYPNYTEASKWYRISAEAGNWYSQFEYGKLCESGLGVLKDKIESLKWYYLSSAKGHVPANRAASSLERELEKEEINQALAAANKILSGDAPSQESPTDSTEHFGFWFYLSNPAFITAVIAAMVALISYRQYLLAKEKLKLDLFEKRFAVYKGTQKFLTVIFSNATCTKDDLFEFRRNTQDGTFLFGKDIPSYINKIDSKALELKSTKEKSTTLPGREERTELATKNTQLLGELIDELPKLKDVFAPYLRFNKWK